MAGSAAPRSHPAKTPSDHRSRCRSLPEMQGPDDARQFELAGLGVDSQMRFPLLRRRPAPKKCGSNCGASSVLYLLAVALATSALTIRAEAEGKGNPTGGKYAVEHPRRNEVNTRIDNQRERINQGVKNGTLTQQQAHSFAPTTALSSNRSTLTSKPTAGT
jgi:hypothetical protein